SGLTIVNLRRQNIASGFGFLDREAAFGISDSPMPKAASRSRKPKPLAMFCRRRLTIVLWARTAKIAASTATKMICRTIPRTLGWRHGAGRLGLVTTVSLATRYPLVSPAKAGIQGGDASSSALNPRFRRGGGMEWPSVLAQRIGIA